MGFVHGTVIADLATLISGLDSFAAGEGWNVEDDGYPATRNVRCYHRDGCYSSMRMGDQQYLGHYQSLGYSSTNHESPWLYPGDDGGGPEATINLTTRRHTNLYSAGPYPAVWMFSPDSAPRYIYVVLEFAAGRYLHFGFGNLQKIGTWTGGAFHYGYYWDASSSNDPTHLWHAFLLDSYSERNQLTAVLQAQGLTMQHADSRWLRSGRASVPAVDRASNPTGRVIGNGIRIGFMSEIPTRQRVTHETAFKAFNPVLLMHQHWETPYSSGTFHNRFSPLGYVPDMAIVNMHGINPAEEIVVGTDTWVVFPWHRKSSGGASDYPESRNAGVAYRKTV